MRVVVTHNQRSMDEIAELVAKSGTFTAPLGLPHYRYDRTRQNVQRLLDGGILKANGKKDIQRFFIKGNNMQRWIEEGKPRAADFCNRIKKERKLASRKDTPDDKTD